MIIEFTQGLCVPYNALRLLRKREIWPYFVGPSLITLCLFFAGLVYLVSQIDSFIGIYLVGWPEWLTPLVWWGATIAVASVLFVIVTFIAIPLASPLNDSLCNAVLSFGDNKVERTRLSSLLHKRTLSVICNEFGKMRYVVLFSLPFVLLTITPVVNVVSPLAWFLFSLWVLAFEYLDYPLYLKYQRSSQTLRIMRKNRAFSAGFGIGMLLITIVPLINFFAVPIGVLAASFSCRNGYLRHV